MAVQLQVVFDAADPPALAAFWGEAIGYKEEDPPEGFDSWEGWAVANDLPREEWDHYASRVDPDGVGALRNYFDRFWDHALANFKAEAERSERTKR